MQSFDHIVDQIERGAVKNEEAGTIPVFYDRQIENKFKSREEKRPVYEGHVYVKIITAGQNKSTVDRKKKDEDEKKYPTAWQRYLDNNTAATDGVPIDEWQGVSRTQAAELKHMNVYTVEHLASVTDANLVNLGPGAMDLRARAQDFLASQTEKDVELTDLKAQMVEMQETIKELKAAAAKPTRKKPGPKPKDVTDDDASEHSTEHA